MGPKVNQEDITRRLSFTGNTCSFNNYDVGQRATQNVSIGQDMWKQLKRVQIPVFSGDKRCYQGWKAAFIACIDNAPATPEYKLLQLRQYLSGEAQHVIDNLGHSATAYEAAKDRLERKYGGKRRQIAIYLDELEHFRQVRHGNARDLEQFADLLDVAIINLKEAGQHHELGDGSLYIKLQRKLPETLLARYHRWIFENNKTESVINLRIWTIQEAEFQTIASETLHGLSAQSSYNEFGRQNSRSQQQRTFYGNLKDNKQMTNMATQCILCERHHLIFMCQEFLQMNASTRWEVAKQNRLCYRCLIGGHRGDSCQNSRRCGIDGCKDTHHRLLHKQGTQVANGLGDGNVDMPQTKPHPPPVNQSEAMEGNRWKYSPSTLEPQTTMVAQGCDTPYFVGLRTVPVILKNGNRELKVNALLDDASTKTYVNADVAAEIGLHGKTEPVKVNVLNGQVETFETTCVSLELRSVDGKAATRVGAYTATRVTGNMNVVDWNKYSGRWQHLQSIIFPRVDSRRPIVDVLIGLDCADLHYALKEIRGRPEEPVARLTPLGWTCTGCPVPGPHESRFLQTNFARTYFAKDQSELVTINESIQRFWDIDNIPTLYNDTFKSNEEKVAVDMAKRSLKYENGMYEVGVPWKEKDVDLPNNYEMALRRLQNTERRLKKTPMIEKSYEQCITQYVEKGYVRKVHEEGQAKSKWYLPHFPVIRLDKDTTKTRIVFDASARFAGVSLNDVIHQGPKLQRELFDVLLRFRRLPIAVVCDIAEMYLRIGIPTQDRLYHRFLWRGMNVDEPPDVYELVSQLDKDRINESVANKGVKWTFNPPLAPNFGGVHETMIKAAKRAISAILGNADINDEELLTAVIGAESLINSRPLTYQSADSADDLPLTPNHFLHGQMGGQFAAETVDSTLFNPRKRWRRVQELIRHFWHRWLREWLPSLTARKKWFRSDRDLQVGDVVLVISPDTTRGNWPLGRILNVYPGRDGRVRVANVQVGRNRLTRPASKLCPLECDIPSTADAVL